MNYGRFGDAISTAQQEVVDATAAMHAPTCTQGPAKNLPAVVCNPDLGKKLADAAKKLEAAKKGGSNMTLLILAVIGIGGFLWWRRRRNR